MRILYFLVAVGLLFADSADGARQSEYSQYQPTISCAELLLTEPSPYEDGVGSLISELRDTLLPLMHNDGYVIHNGVSPQDVLHYIEHAEPEDALVARSLMHDAECENRARRAPKGEMITRAGVDRVEIADTLRSVGTYLLKKNIGPAYNQLAQLWLANDGTAALVEASESYHQLEELFTQSPQLVAQLRDAADILEFFAYRERLEGGGEAKNLLNRIHAFRGTLGPGGEGLHARFDERLAFIGRSPRHRSEKYRLSGDAQADQVNALHLAFNQTDRGWLPTGDGQVEWREHISSAQAYAEFGFLERRQRTLLQGFKRADINAHVSVQLGETYGTDQLTVRMSLEDYLNKYIPVKTGQRRVAIGRVIGSGHVAGPHTRKMFLGWEPGRNVFYGPGGLYISERVDLPARERQSLGWLRSLEFQKTKKIEVRNVDVPHWTDPYTLYRTDEPDLPPIVHAGGRYWRRGELMDERARVMEQIARIANDFAPVLSVPVERSHHWAEIAGAVYIPYSGPFNQAFLHMVSTYHVRSKTVSEASLKEDVTSLLGRRRDSAYEVIALSSLAREAKDELYEALFHIEKNLRAGGDGMIDLREWAAVRGER